MDLVTRVRTKPGSVIGALVARWDGESGMGDARTLAQIVTGRCGETAVGGIDQTTVAAFTGHRGADYRSFAFA
ncbi:hypothetical protein GCM10027444_25490 [Actinopolyspora lacussalsi]